MKNKIIKCNEDTQINPDNLYLQLTFDFGSLQNV
jgi:hypothetical protein